MEGRRWHAPRVIRGLHPRRLHRHLEQCRPYMGLPMSRLGSVLPRRASATCSLPVNTTFVLVTPSRSTRANKVAALSGEMRTQPWLAGFPRFLVSYEP